MVDTETWTLGRLLDWTTKYLQNEGSSTARLDSEVLLAEATGLQRIDLYTRFAQVADERVRTTFRELVRRRAEGTPVAYLVGRREFYSLQFRVSPDVLIPRPESEYIIITLLDLIADHSSQTGTVDLADVGTGSGNLAVCAAKELPRSRVTATDVSEAALTIARANVLQHDLENRIDLIHGDLLEPVPMERQFDFIISNPPYVTTDELQQLAPDVKDHEPHVALDGGPDGTTVIARLIVQAAERLKPGGWLICEISPMIKNRVLQLLKGHSGFDRIAVVKDLGQNARVVKARRKKGEPSV